MVIPIRSLHKLEHGEPPRKTVQPQYYMALVTLTCNDLIERARGECVDGV
jgi:hypothetical protein